MTASFKEIARLEIEVGRSLARGFKGQRDVTPGEDDGRRRDE